ncbi:DUF2975 domain-containing protein [Antribacter gilvus]|uniref:DUF2975 domain-containing protein n=1 Tax=Antribacter gilvus TaxID=2304675 RepID=UPI000F7A972F|nr:DUF2975 domain-containing protein [Antribacter gilvus]
MGKLTVLALRIVLAALFLGAVFIHVVMVPLIRTDMNELNPDYAYLRVPVLTIIVLGMVAVEVVLFCVWRLTTMVKAGTVFSHAAFRYVDVIIGAVVAAAGLIFAFAVVLAPGEAAAPGLVLLICIASLAVLGVALVVLVLRALLKQAVDRDVEASQLKAELDEVI